MAGKRLAAIDRVERIDPAPDDDPSRLGTWWWLDVTDWDGQTDKRLVCVVAEGSNYVEVESVYRGAWRVHVDNIEAELTPEPNAKAVIAAEIARCHGEAEALMKEADAIARRLGIAEGVRRISGPGDTGTALAAPTGRDAVKKHERALVKAKDETLPEIFKKITATYEEMGKWMAADLLLLQGQLGTAREVVAKIENRIHAIELYAGVTEEVVECCGGDNAGAGERVRLLQRRLYMDEECLLDYRAGGMEFKDIDRFDAWICRPKNRDRILPFPKCVVSMRVRRMEKERASRSMLDAFINFRIAESDKLTFLYIRNGDRVFRLSTSIDFGEKLFPDQATFDPQRPMMAQMFGNSVDKLITVAEYEQLKAEAEERDRLSAEWRRANPEAHSFDDPHREIGIGFHEHRYQPFNPSSVYYDDIADIVAAKIAQYNRVAVIIQGLFDRSPVFRPHNMPKVWRPDDFLRAVELIYDASAVLTAGESPDFEAYRAELNASLTAASVTIGQEMAWMLREAKKENSRRQFSRHYHPVRLYRPNGDPGPGFCRVMDAWRPSRREALFRWKRQAQSSNWERGRRYGDPVPASIVVPATSLFNVSAYKPGDFCRFYADPRTRPDYLQWAPFLLGAEDWHGGKTSKRGTDDED